jgi:basic membrane protein A
MNHRRWLSVLAVAAAVALSTTAAASAATTQSHHAAVVAKRSLAGKKVAVLVAGDSHDQGFYQGQVEALQKLAKQYKFTLVVIDKVGIGTSTEAFQNAARQSPAILLSTGSELLDGFNAVCNNPQFQGSGIFFMSQAAFPPQCKSAVHFTADDFQSHYLGGVAAALLLQTQGKPNGTVATVAGPPLSFVTDDNKALAEGLKSQLPNAQFKISYTGDFENAALASEATNAFINQGANVLYPYLGGAVIAATTTANQAHVPILSVSIDGCNIPPPGPQFAGSVLFNPAPGFGPMFAQYVKGTLKAGDFKVFGLETPGVGANICNATAAQQKVLNDTKAKILSGQIKVKTGGFVKLKNGNFKPR